MERYLIRNKNTRLFYKTTYAKREFLSNNQLLKIVLWDEYGSVFVGKKNLRKALNKLTKSKFEGSVEILPTVSIEDLEVLELQIQEKDILKEILNE